MKNLHGSGFYPITTGEMPWVCDHAACKHRASLAAFWVQETREYRCPSCLQEPGNIPVIYPKNPKTGQVNRFYTPTPKQILALLCPARNLLWGGRAGTGKSHWLRCEAYMRCLTIPGYRALLLRRQFTELRDTHLDKAALEAGLFGATYRASEFTVVFSNGSRLRFGHCENDDAVKTYLSSEFDWIGFDEGSTFTEYAFRFICSRLRTAKTNVIPLCRIGSNPGAQWLYRLFIAKDLTEEEWPTYKPDDYCFIPATIDDNPHVNIAEQEARLAALPSEALRKMYRDGDWTAVEGQMFDEWRRSTIDATDIENPTMVPWHVITDLPQALNPTTGEHEPIDVSPVIPMTVVMDWGYDPDPCVVIWYAHMPGGRFIAVQEWVCRKTLPREVAKGIIARSRGLKIRQHIAGHDIWMKEHETGQPMAEVFARHGVSFTPATTDRENGWIALHALLKDTVDDGRGPLPMLQVFDGGGGLGCPTLSRTIPMLQNNPKKPGDCLERDDHAPDTARYFAISRPTPPRDRKSTAWDRLSPEQKRRIRRTTQGGRFIGSDSVRRRH